MNLKPSIIKGLLLSCLVSLQFLGHALAANTPDQRIVMGYYTNWGTYKGFPVGNPQLNEQAKNLNVLAYAFFEVDSNGTLYFSDPWSDLKASDAGFCAKNPAICNNTKGTEGLGNFTKLTRENIYPNTKIVISVGGAGHDETFRSAFRNIPNFIASLGAIINEYKIAGIDLDFEPSAWSASDANNYVKLAEEIRKNFPTILITAAVTANPDVIKQFQASNWQSFAKSVNYIGVMAYDFHGGFDGLGNRTGFHSNLYSDDSDPYQNHFSGDAAVKTYIEMGVPANKLLLGVPAYGRMYGEVVDGGKHGLYQNIGALYSKGDLDKDMESYRSIIGTKLGKGYVDYWYSNTSGAYSTKLNGVFAYNANERVFISFDNTALIDEKAKYVKENKLGGMMMWELRADITPSDPNNASLLKHMFDGVK